MKVDPPYAKTIETVQNSSFFSPVSPGKRPQDVVVTMARSKTLVDKVLGLWGTAKSFFSTTWNWIWWFARFCPIENTRIETLEEIIKDPEKAAEAAKGDSNKKDAPFEYLSEVIAAALIDPGNVRGKIGKNKAQIGKFACKFKELVPQANLLKGKGNVFDQIKAALTIFSRLSAEQIFVKFLLDRPQLVSSAINCYCEKALSQLDEKEVQPDQLEQFQAARLILSYFKKVAAQSTKDPAGFKQFLEGLFALRSFSLTEIGKLAHESLSNLTKEEQKAFGKQIALNRLLDPKTRYFGLSKPLGVSVMYQTLLEQCTPKHFEDLGALMKENYPLGAEVCDQLEDIAEHPSQFKKVCANLPKAWPILKELLEVFNNPPSE